MNPSLPELPKLSKILFLNYKLTDPAIRFGITYEARIQTYTIRRPKPIRSKLYSDSFEIIDFIGT